MVLKIVWAVVVCGPAGSLANVLLVCPVEGWIDEGYSWHIARQLQQFLQNAMKEQLVLSTSKSLLEVF